MAPGASVFAESQSVQSSLAAAVPGGREHHWSLLPNKTPSPRADPSPLLSPTCIVSADPRPGRLRSRSLGFRSSSSSLSAVQLAHRAPGDRGLTSRKPGVPGPAVEVGEGWYTLNWKVALQMWKEGQTSGGLFLSGPGESVEPFLDAPSAHLCRDGYSGLPCSEVPPMDSVRLTMPIPGLQISPFPVCLQSNLF